jgi:hypothetical protein
MADTMTREQMLVLAETIHNALWTWPFMFEEMETARDAIRQLHAALEAEPKVLATGAARQTEGGLWEFFDDWYPPDSVPAGLIARKVLP